MDNKNNDIDLTSLELKKIYMKEYYVKNKEKTKEYYLRNRDKILKSKREKSKTEEEKLEKSEYMKVYSELNREKMRENKRKSYHRNKDKRNADKKEYNKSYYLENKEKIDNKNKKYYLENKGRNFDNSTNLVRSKKLESDLFKIMINMRCLISRTIRKGGYKKSSRSEEILGCTFYEFKTYLELKFESWMSWENYGKYNGELNYGWDIDHIIPVSSAKTEEELIKLNHYLNLQPLCSYKNRYIKKNMYYEVY